MNVVSSAIDAKDGHRGRSCAYDCGPHASCRCGICVAGGDDNKCHLPDCEECQGSLVLIMKITFAFAIVFVCLLIYAMLTVFHAMNKRGRQITFSKQWCCLLNPMLYTDSSNTLFKCIRVPPMILLICSVVLFCLFVQVLLHTYRDILHNVSAVIDEEYCPSDHRMLVVELEIK